MTENDFVFDGVTLSDHGYIVTWDGTYSEDGVVSSMSYETVKASRSDVVHKVSSSYEENYHVDVIIAKSPCGDENMYLTNDDISEMSRWLCRKEYKWFRWIDDHLGQDEIWFEVQITMDKEAYGDSIIGLKLHISANRPYGVTRERKIKWDNAEGQHIVNIYSDEEGYINPDVVITARTDGDISILNEREDRTTEIKNCVAGEVITIHGGDLLQITSTEDHDFAKDFNYVFPRFYNEFEKNKNTITVTGMCDIEIRYRGLRKVGM